ncbi:cytochrome b [Methylobacterium sp. C33D]
MTQPARTTRTAARSDDGTRALHRPTAVRVPGLWRAGSVLEDRVPSGAQRSGIWSVHHNVGPGRGPAGLVAAHLARRRTGGRDLPAEDPGPLHRLAQAIHAALYVPLLVIAGLGIADARVRGGCRGRLSLPRLGDPACRAPLTRWHGLAALVHHDVRRDAVLRRTLSRRS